MGWKGDDCGALRSRPPGGRVEGAGRRGGRMAAMAREKRSPEISSRNGDRKRLGCGVISRA